MKYLGCPPSKNYITIDVALPPGGVKEVWPKLDLNEVEVIGICLNRIMREHDGYAFDDGEISSIRTMQGSVVHTLSFTYYEDGHPAISTRATFMPETGIVTVSGEGFREAVVRILIRPKTK